jgi:hypothetical protein
MAVFFFLVISIDLAASFFNLRRAYREGNSSLIEGTVTDFSPAPLLGPHRESFAVNGVRFSYNTLDSTPCFTNAAFHHGPIVSGLQIRLYYHENCIQRVDVRR